MKRFYIIIALFCIAISAKAQFGVGGGGPNIVGRISGTVIDSITKKPMDYTTVGLYRVGGKSPLNGVLTDDKGNFKIDGVKPGTYSLKISFIGYPTKIVEPVVTSASKPDNKLGNIFISPGAKALATVNVVGQAPLIENKIDKIVYNAEKDLTSAGGNATDVLQKVPLVNVDINGNVSIRGDQNVRVLINGKPSGATSASLADVLKTIPADQIKSIEVVTSPSAKYDAEGSGGIINIITKQKNVSGISGSVSGGVGTRQNNGNINLNYNKNRFSLGVNVGGNLTWPQTSLTTSDQLIKNPITGDVLVRNFNNSTSRIKRHGAIGSVTLGYEFNAFNSINSTFRLNDGGFNTNGGGLNKTDSAAVHSETNTTTKSNNHFGGFDWNLDYTHKFKKEGEELVVSGQWSHSEITTDYTSLFKATAPGQIVKNPNQSGNNDGKNNEYTFQADYTLPVNKVVKVEAGGKTIQRRINSNYDVFNTDADGNNPLRDVVNSNLYDYNQNVYAGYTVLTFTLPKSYSVLVGGRVENTRIKGDPRNPYQDAATAGSSFQVLEPFNSNYTTYVPSLTIQKVLGSQTLKLSYTKRIQRPSLQFLNPFINRTNQQNQSVGNPNLAPEVSQTVELNINKFVKSSVINFSVYYKHTNNLIEGIGSSINDTINMVPVVGTRTKYFNVAKNNSFGASFFGSINPIKPLTIRASINAYTYDPTVFDAFSNQASATGVYFQYSAFGSASYQFPHNFLAELFGFTNSARRNIQGTNPAFGIYAFGIKKQFMDKKLAIGFNTVQPFARDKHFDTNINSEAFSYKSSTAFPFRSFGITFSYSFGKLSFSNPQQQKKGVNNDDTKQGDQGGGQGGAPTGGR